MRTIPGLTCAFLLLSPSAAFAFSQRVHVEISTEALSEAGYDVNAASAVVAGNLITDSDEYTVPAAHFDDEAFAAGSARLNAKLAAALDALDDCDPAKAREQVGRALHAVQDFFAHANWVETHASTDTIDLFRLRDPGPAVSCDPKTRQGPLTSGYYPDDKRPAPNKCVHGEINKDGPDRPFFAPARARALAETKAVLARFDQAIYARFAASGPKEGAYRIRLLKDSSKTFAIRRFFCHKHPQPAPALQSAMAPVWP